MNNWDKISFLSPQELREIQNTKLRNFISYQIYPFSPYYRKLFEQHKIKPRYIKTVEDLKIIPFTKKEDLFSTKEHPNRFIDFILHPDEALIKKYWPKYKLLNLAFFKAVK